MPPDPDPAETTPDGGDAPPAPLFVDLDGALIATDLLWESLFVLLRRSPLLLLAVPFWALLGRSALSDRVARLIALPPESLPYDPAVLGLIRERRERGGPVVLATAEPEAWALPIAEHLGVFDGVLAARPDLGRAGPGRLGAIRRYCEGRGWPASDPADDATLRRAGEPRRPLVAALRALRPYQWAKNGLIFVPIVTGHRVTDPGTLLASVLAFLAFSLAASAVYLVNDLADLAHDRAHAEKRRRPFASGQLPLAWGPPLTLALLAASFAIAALALPRPFLGVLTLYLSLTTLYSLALKSRLLVDVLALASLYSMRIFAGGVATGIVISEWLMVFSIFFFLSLAFAKRFIELDRAIASGELGQLPGRGYQPIDIGLVETFGAISGYLSTLVLALYIRSDEVRPLYPRPEALWLVVLCLIYWISRIWFLARRHALPDDPVVFALRDSRSLATGLICALALAAATLWPS